MRTNQLQSRIGGAVLAVSLLLGIGIALSATTQAQYPNAQYPNGRDAQGRSDRDSTNRDRHRYRRGRGRDGDGYGNYGGSAHMRQTALNAGYNEGIKQGRSDRNRRNRSDFRSRSAYQKATKDYSSGLGDREVYRRYYREAYENAYELGLSGG